MVDLQELEVELKDLLDLTLQDQQDQPLLVVQQLRQVLLEIQMVLQKMLQHLQAVLLDHLTSQVMVQQVVIMETVVEITVE